MNTFQAIYKVVAKIPKGKVATYKQIGSLTGVSPRIVGFALHANKDPLNIPCHRIIRNDGTLASGYAFGGKKEQIRKLKQEGVEIVKNMINLQKYLY